MASFPEITQEINRCCATWYLFFSLASWKLYIKPMNILMQTSHSYSSIKKEPDKKTKKSLYSNEYLTFSWSWQWSFLLPSYSNHSCRQDPTRSVSKDMKSPRYKKNKNPNRLDTILHWKYSVSDMLILIAFTKPKIGAVVQTRVLKSYKIYY